MLKGLARFLGILKHCTGRADVLFDLAQFIENKPFLGAEEPERYDSQIIAIYLYHGGLGTHQYTGALTIPMCAIIGRL